jgi:hypothetical protein
VFVTSRHFLSPITILGEIPCAFDLFLLRYLRARAFDPKDALIFLKEDMAWREEM